MTTTTRQYIQYQKDGGIARVTLNRPEKLNALSQQLQNELSGAVAEADADDEVHVIVIKGNGRAFSAGYDITPRQESDEDRRQRTIRRDIQNLRRTQGRWDALLNTSKPVIAQVHGYCLAGGTDLALHCDIIVAAEDATFGFPAVRAMGSPPTHMWTYLVGPQWAKYLIMTGNSVDGKTAERIGLVWKAVPAAQLEAEVESLAGTLAKIPSDLLIANKGIVNKALDHMGRAMVEQLAAENDAVAHMAPAVEEFRRTAAERGLKSALDQRDSPFRDYRGAAAKRG